MSDAEAEAKEQSIIIVKRGGGDHDDHHGGVWKIAFADFMTAMMAFFLVMWLINASNDETRSQVASYFNPVKLTDAVAAPKGVRNDDPVTKMNAPAEETGAGGEEGGGKKPEAVDSSEADGTENAAGDVSESALFKDPYAVLVDIAGEAEQINVAQAPGDPRDGDLGLGGGEAFRDPFDPEFWEQPEPADRSEHDSPQATLKGIELPDGVMAEIVADADKPVQDEKTTKAEPRSSERPSARNDKATMVEDQRPESKPAESETTTDMAEVDAGMKGPLPADAAMNKVQAGEDMKPSEQADTEAERQKQVVEQVKSQIAQVAETMEPGVQPRFSVEKTDEGLVVSLTDDLDFGMFAIASARPNEQMVRFMDRIAAVLSKRPGRLVVRGHTDSRPFRSDTYDNWRLSTARAHMAYHMLVRGGIDESRFARIEGRADRDPKNTADRESAENRRIEILLMEEQS